jgi:phosphopantothenoylcysteine decarboxylase/phosphopantothenate--cysteine ligase
VKVLVTAGPTYEPLDEVRRLTNFSTGGLGTRLANWLSEQGHEVTLLLGEQATWTGERRVARLASFSTTADLAVQLRRLSAEGFAAVFHAAAVSDFGFGRRFRRAPAGHLEELPEPGGKTGLGKLPSRESGWLVELVATPKLIAELRGWFPRARLVGWKYEVDGARPEALAHAERQVRECRTDGSVANGPAYGEGFGLVAPDRPTLHLPDEASLFPALAGLVTPP